MPRPGRVVECKDGAIGRTYNDLPLVPVAVRLTDEYNGEELPPPVNKVQVFVFAESRENMRDGKTISPPERRLCLPEDKKFVTDKDLKNWDFYKTDSPPKSSPAESPSKKPPKISAPPRNPDHHAE
jgi:hypothetical protein